MGGNTGFEKPTKKRVEENPALENPTKTERQTHLQSPKNPSGSKSTVNFR